MRLIGGLAFWDPAKLVSVRELRAMAGRVAGSTEGALCASRGSVGLFTTAGIGHLEATPDVCVIADLDLTNLAELQALVGTVDGARLLTTLYLNEGSAFVPRLQGAFALALWDRRHQSLLLASDRFGTRRLYYVSDPRRTAFATRASALLAAPGMTAEADLESVYNFLNFGYVPAPASVFRGVRRLPPGHCLVLRAGAGLPEPYWDMTYREERWQLTSAAKSMREVTAAAVGRCLGDVGTKDAGVFLSGGTDSSTVTGLASRITGERVNAFSVSFREDRYDELAYAEIAARHFGAAHYVRTVTPAAALAALPRLVQAFDEPFGNNSAIGTLACAELARECGTSLLLAGDGGDEVFGGNERYCTDRIFSRYQLLPRLLRRGVLEPALRALPEGVGGPLDRARRYVRRANIPNPRRFYSYEFFVAQHAAELLSPEFRAALPADVPWGVLERHYARVPGAAELNRLLYLDLKLTIADNDLLKVTRTAEMAGVAVRFPLLDLQLVEFTGRLPAHFKVRGLEKRYLFKRAFRELLPREILAKPKHGFGVPTSLWLKDDPGFRELAGDTLLASRARQRGYFAPGAIERLFHQHTTDSTPYYGDILWTLLTLELWHRRHLDEVTSS